LFNNNLPVFSSPQASQSIILPSFQQFSSNARQVLVYFFIHSHLLHRTVLMRCSLLPRIHTQQIKSIKMPWDTGAGAGSWDNGAAATSFNEPSGNDFGYSSANDFGGQAANSYGAAGYGGGEAGGGNDRSCFNCGEHG
jgi:hypothetical protein